MDIYEISVIKSRTPISFKTWKGSGSMIHMDLHKIVHLPTEYIIDMDNFVDVYNNRCFTLLIVIFVIVVYAHEPLTYCIEN